MATKTTKKSKQALIKGIKNAHITLITKDDMEGVIYDSETHESPVIKEIKMAVSSESVDIEASNSLYDSFQGAKAAEIGITLLALPTKVKAAILGRKYEEANGIPIIGISEDGRPQAFAFTTELPATDGGTVFICFPKLKATKELETTLKSMYKQFEELPDEYACKSIPIGDGDLFVMTDVVAEEDAVKIREKWHTEPPQTFEKMKELVKSIIVIQTK